MEIMNRNRSASTNSAGDSSSGRHSRLKDNSLLRLASAALFVSVTILAVALLWFVVLGNPNSESQQVDNDRLQAVSMNTGHVYFGHIRSINDDYIRMTDVYNFRVNDQADAGNNNSTLAKRGCEQHRPQDEMFINKDQVLFWENLKDEDSASTVPGAIKQYIADHPEGQTCEE